MKKFKKVLDNVAAYRDIVVMSKIRDAILSKMRTSGFTTYRLSKMVEGKVPQRTVYDFLSGNTDASTEVASVLMDALGLTVCDKQKLRKGRRPRKEV